jgi:magnesium transporter
MTAKSKHKKKRHPHIHRRTKPGAMPGTIAVDPEAPRPLVRLMAYGADTFLEQEITQLDQVRDYLGKFPVVWLNVDSLGDAQLLEKLGEMFGLHRLALEDVVNVHQRAKVEQYGDWLFIVARMADLQLRAHTEQLSMFLGSNFLITFQEEPGDCWEGIRQRLRDGVGRLRSHGSDFLAYSLMDAVIDDYFPVLEHYSERLEALEDMVLSESNRHTIDHIHQVKSDLLMLRRAIWPHREALSLLARESTPVFTAQTRVYLRDCYDHVVQLIDLIETYRELTADLRDLHMSAVSNRINETMRVLTIIATVFMPLTFISGIYGMNFDHMPELHWVFGYPFALALMGLSALAMLALFYWRGWFGFRSREPLSKTDETP